MSLWQALPILAVVLAPPYATAQTTDLPNETDPRIASVQYDPARIIRLEVPQGKQTLVELTTGEVIQTIGMGDSAAWQVQAGKRGDIFFVRNVSATAATSMSVVTAARVYHFELAPPAGYGEVGLYHVKIVLPSLAPLQDEADASPRYEYKLKGARSIRPSKVYQQAGRVFVEWPDSVALPGTFMVEDGEEALVNGTFENGQLVVTGTPAKLVFRLDRRVASATRIGIRKASDD